MPTIATSVELIFDKQLSAEIRGIWDSFTGARIRYQPHAEQGHPHITVSVREKNGGNWMPVFESLARKMNPFEIMFSSVGMFLRPAGLGYSDRTDTVVLPANRAELLLLSPSILVPCLTHKGVRIWDTLAIAEYLHEVKPKAGLLPAERAARARCRSICGEMHSGFTNLRSALPMNLKAHRPGFKIWSGAQADIERIATIWRECFAAHHGPYLFGKLTMADAMYAPVVTRFLTYDVKLDRQCAGYCERIMSLPDMVAWRSAAMLEPEELEELDMEF